MKSVSIYQKICIRLTRDIRAYSYIKTDFGVENLKTA